MSLDIQKIRKDFPILSQQVYKKPLIYFDNGATTQKPRVVIDEEIKIYTQENSNIHRGVHFLSEQLTQRYEEARKVVQEFINAPNDHEVIFTSGTTESINTIAFSFGEKYVYEGDEIIISTLEHHANIVPWQMLCESKKAVLKVIPINERGEILLDEYEKMISPKTKIVSVNHVSNALGTVNDIKRIIEIAHQNNVPVLIDGAQSIQHDKVDVQELDCDFYVFSGHKVYGPNVIGVIYGKEKWLNEIPPFMTGGEMIKKVTFEKTTFNELPFKFEAGTPNYVAAIGLATAIEYIQQLGLENIVAYEKELLNYATQKLESIEGLKIVGTAENKVSVISFNLENIHPYDAGMVIDKMGIAVRTGHHCAEPLMQRLNIEGTIRASFSFYNTKEEIDKLCEAIMTVKQMFG